MASNEIDLEHMEWLIDRRGKVRGLMGDLYAFIRKNPRLEKDRGPDMLLYGHLVAIVFSLWRAVFLADNSRAWKKVFPQLRLALSKLIRNNTFLYPDEKIIRLLDCDVPFAKRPLTYFLCPR